MLGLSATLSYLLFSWIAVTAAMFALVIYGNTLSAKETDQLYLHAAGQAMAATPQENLIARMNRLARVITVLAVCSAVLLVAIVGVWAWIGLQI